MTIFEIQEECKKRFPIGCTFVNDVVRKAETLIEDEVVYLIDRNKHVYAHRSGGCLYDGDTEQYAVVVSLPDGYIVEPDKPKDYSYLEAFLNKLNIK